MNENEQKLKDSQLIKQKIQQKIIIKLLKMN